jgi:hypothetical protein
MFDVQLETLIEALQDGVQDADTPELLKLARKRSAWYDSITF